MATERKRCSDGEQSPCKRQIQEHVPIGTVHNVSIDMDDLKGNITVAVWIPDDKLEKDIASSEYSYADIVSDMSYSTIQHILQRFVPDHRECTGNYELASEWLAVRKDDPRIEVVLTDPLANPPLYEIREPPCTLADVQAAQAKLVARIGEFVDAAKVYKAAKVTLDELYNEIGEYLEEST